MQAQTVSGGHQASLQMIAALRMLRAVFGSPGNPFVGDRAVVEFFAQYHFLHFARLFHDLPDGGHSLVLCKAHLQVGTHLPRESGSLCVSRMFMTSQSRGCGHRRRSSLCCALASELLDYVTSWNLKDCSLQDSLGFANADASEWLSHESVLRAKAGGKSRVMP